MKIKNSINAGEFVKTYKTFSLPSLTVPDQTMSLQTILERYTRGLPVGGRTDIYYDEEDDLPDPRTLDLAERQDLAEKFKTEIDFVRNRKKNVSTNVDNSVDNSEGVIKTDETES